MATYRLRAAKRQEDGSLGMPGIDDAISANSLEDAIAEAKGYTIDRVLNESTDFAWLVDPKGATVWQLKMEES